MKLYNTNVSPYASRVRIAIYARNLPVAIVAPPGGQGSAEYEQLHPTGKLPALAVDARERDEQREAVEQSRKAGGR